MTSEIHGLPYPASDPAYDDAVARKSNLLLEAKLLSEQGQDDQATHRFAEAARIETDLAEYCAKRGYPESAHMHRYSAVGCWARAGNFYDALVICDGLLE